MSKQKKIHVSTTVNSEPCEFLCEPYQVLSEVLRNNLNLTGTKEGCNTGDCGACSVLLDGTLVCSCLVLAVEAEDRTIETIEGVGEEGKLHPIQQKLLEHAALRE
jgi:carbon-monoxide dehydrogenase small subunit